MSDLPTRIEKFLAPTTANPLRDLLGLETIGDLIHHYPRRYVERDVLTPLKELREGEYVTVQARVKSVNKVDLQKRHPKEKTRSMVKVVVTDDVSTLSLTFFNAAWRYKQLRPGRIALFAGKVESFRGTRQLTNPQTDILGDDEADASNTMLRPLVPVYPAATKLPSWKVDKAVASILDIVDVGPDPIPEEVRRKHDLLDLADALRRIHRPQDWSDIERARRRLKWDEAFVLQVVLAQRRATANAQAAVSRRPVTGGLVDAFDKQLPFELTEGQLHVSAQIFDDIAQAHPMHRLLQGEVGSGKTVVALRAMLAVVDSGGQAALLAPTEVLAQQHHRTISAMLGPLAEAGQLGGAEVATRVALLTGSQRTQARRTNLLDAAVGDAGIVVGTHALLEENVQFRDLGLVVVDEQHRFGVEQRDALRMKGEKPPHVLVMTATPIPRTVAMTVYGDLETSLLTELPKGRSPIQTNVVPLMEHPTWLDRAWQRVREEVEAGRQAYVVCPTIDSGAADDREAGDEDVANDEDSADDEKGASSKRPLAAVSSVTPLLAEGSLSGLRVEQLHGRMQPDAKDDVMRRFAAGDIDVLVATTVIEVGVDVPNATVMVVLDADRFGVSQLHQLRGRVGRGAHPGLCILVTSAPADGPARERLDGVAATLDGLALARLDLEQRREGDVLGSVQSGRRSSLRLLRLLTDEDLITEARAEAVALVAADPSLDAHPELGAAVAEMVDAERTEFLEKA
jgi:ATP-dependent DNA helicase RecG